MLVIAVPAINFSHSWDMHKGSNGKFTYKNIEVGVIITILNDKSDDATKSNGTVMGEDVSEKGGKSGVIDLSGVALLSRPKPSEAIHMTATDVRSYDTSGGKYYMDITTDCDIYWAPYNVGATSPTEVGNYYAWGETEPKAEYSWATYKWMETGYPNWRLITKYTFADGKTEGSWYTLGGAFIGDGKTTLDPEDDAATVKLGSPWRMPTSYEIKELLDNCTWTWTTQDGIIGCEVKGLNGNSIFLPAAGYRYSFEFDHAGIGGSYWSSSLSTAGSDEARYLGFTEVRRDCYNNGSRAVYGFSVRPVHP